MSDWSRLTIGEVIFSWRYEVPSFLTFVFQEDDLFIKREEIPPEPGEEDREYDPDELMIEEAGFRTTVAKAKAVLDRYGYTRSFFAEVYASFRDGLDEAAKEILVDELGALDPEATLEGIEDKVRRHLSTSSSTPLGDLDAFTEFLRTGIAADFKVEPFTEDVQLAVQGEIAVAPSMERTKLPTKIAATKYIRYRRSLLAEFESLQSLLIQRAHRVPANVLRPFILFDEGYLAAFPEVISLLYTRLVLDATSDDGLVELDVHEVVETEAQLRSLHGDLAYELLHKVEVYERVFRALSSREEDVQDRYARSQVRNALTSLDDSEDAQGKGEALEALMAAAFSLRPQLEVVESRYSTGDEEIDLIVKNNVNRPFWHGLVSPLIFAECKNWADPVGAPEVRNFEVKLQNHAPLAKVGVLIAPGGFTREVPNAIKRGSRDDYSIFLVDRADLERLAQGAETVLDWLERLLSRPI